MVGEWWWHAGGGEGGGGEAPRGGNVRTREAGYGAKFNQGAWTNAVRSEGQTLSQ
jgi:hypothetical protein